MLTLIIPVGGPGAGKTTLCQNLIDGIIPSILEEKLGCIDKLFTTCRDDIYTEVKNQNPGISQRRLRRLLYDRFVTFKTEVLSTYQLATARNVVVYIDSANAQNGGRKYIIENFNPDRVLIINMRRSAEMLLQRVAQRTGHPTFPSDSATQTEIVNKILSGLEFATSSNESKYEIIEY